MLVEHIFFATERHARRAGSHFRSQRAPPNGHRSERGPRDQSDRWRVPVFPRPVSPQPTGNTLSEGQTLWSAGPSSTRSYPSHADPGTRTDTDSRIVARGTRQSPTGTASTPRKLWRPVSPQPTGKPLSEGQALWSAGLCPTRSNRFHADRKSHSGVRAENTGNENRPKHQRRTRVSESNA